MYTDCWEAVLGRMIDAYKGESVVVDLLIHALVGFTLYLPVCVAGVARVILLDWWLPWKRQTEVIVPEAVTSPSAQGVPA